MASSLEHATGILPLYNDDVLTTCRQLLKENRPSYKTMNNVIGQSLVSILYPTANSKKSELGLFSTSCYSYGCDNVLSEI